MRIFLAGATGVIGIRLLGLLVADGHTVAGMTRSPDKRDRLVALDAEPVVCDVFDADALTDAVTRFRPDAVLHQLTDLPDRAEQLREFAARNDRIRGEGTRNLIAAARAAGAPHLLAQSIAWTPSGRAEVIASHEQQILDAGGVVVRYGQLYGPGHLLRGRAPAASPDRRRRRRPAHGAADHGAVRRGRARRSPVIAE